MIQRRPDGLYEVPLPQGGTIGTAMPPSKLGIRMPPARELPLQPDMRLASTSDGWMGAIPENPGAMPGRAPAAPTGKALEAKILGTDTPKQEPGPQGSGPGELEPVSTGQGPAGVDYGAPGGTTPGQAYARNYVEDALKPRYTGPVQRHHTPAYYQPTARASELGPHVSGEDIEALGETDIDRRLAMQDHASTTERDMRIEARRQALELAKEDERNQLEQARINERERVLNERVGKQESLYRDRLDKARKMQVEPNRVFHNLGTFGTILAAVAAGLGQYAAGLNGGRNAAQEIIDKAIDRDIAAQQDAIMNARDDAEAQRTELGRLYGEFGDINLAKGVLRDQMNALKTGVAENRAKLMKADQIPVDFQQWLAEDRAKQAQRDAEFRAQAMGVQRLTEAYVPDKTWTTGGWYRPDPEKVLRKGAATGKLVDEIYGAGSESLTPEERKDRRERFVPGVGYSYSASEAPKVRQAVEAQDRFERGAERIADIRKQVAEGKMSRIEGMARIKSVGGQLTQGLRVGEQMGALDNGAVEQADKIMGDSDSVFSVDGKGKNQLDEFMRGQRRKFDKYLETNVSKDPEGRSPLTRTGPPSTRSEE